MSKLQQPGLPTFAAMTPGAGLKAAIGKGRADIIGEISASGLKGRGGAGFPVGVKWNLCGAARGDQKYVVCNADEGEPGTFKDRVILTEYADLVFEGMTIGGLTVGAKEGILYLRAEYTYLRRQLEAVLAKRREAKLLGQGHPGQGRLRLRHPHPDGRGRLRLRRGDRPDRVARRAPRRAAQPAAVPGRHRLSRPPDDRQQRRDPGLGRLHPPEGGPPGSRASAPRSPPG